MLKLHTLRQLLSLTAQTLLLLGGVFATHLHVGQNPDTVALDGLKQLLEQRKGLALVFLLRVLLGVATQVDTVTQMVRSRMSPCLFVRGALCCPGKSDWSVVEARGLLRLFAVMFGDGGGGSVVCGGVDGGS